MTPTAGRVAPTRLPPALTAAILAWYDDRGRALPFRSTRDPYPVLVSEVMAQQTQIARVAERWASFLGRFPSFAVLAQATPADVVREWRGMGYNRRALGLWRTARVVMEDHRGELPRDIAALERLPGIGPYTARAVAAIAFGDRAGAVDTNVRRVLGRIVAGGDGLGATELQAVADAAVPATRPGDWTHALMDLGATLCRSRQPRCGECPARRWCRLAGTGATVTGAATPRAIRVDRSEPFARTTRWLRGRIVERLGDEPGDGWVEFRAAIGEHGPSAVTAALAGLAREGLVELDPVVGGRARLARS
jgi:A/G-specific adenine glycosylase